MRVAQHHTQNRIGRRDAPVRWRRKFEGYQSIEPDCYEIVCLHATSGHVPTGPNPTTGSRAYLSSYPFKSFKLADYVCTWHELQHWSKKDREG